MIIKFTKFTSKNQGAAKSYNLDGETLVKEDQQSLYEGIYETVRIDHEELKSYIVGMKTGDYLTQGINIEQTKGSYPHDARRLKDNFTFTNQPGLICIDVDLANDFNLTSFDDIYNVFIKVEPSLKGVMFVMSSSASSYIFCDGEVKNGLRGIHIHIPIDSTEENERILNVLHARLVNHNFGVAKVTKSGQIRIHSLVDLALTSSNQPIFEGKAILKSDRLSQVRQVRVYGSKVLPAKQILDLTSTEKTIFKAICDELRSTKEKEAHEVHMAFINYKSEQLRKNDTSLSSTGSEYVIDQASTKKVLLAQFPIVLENAENEVVTVLDILKNKKKFHQQPCRHPLDESIVGKSIIYSDQEVPLIHTFSHGGEIYYLAGANNKKDWEIAYDDFVDDFNKTHAMALYGRQHCIIRLKNLDQRNTEKRHYEYIKQKELEMIYVNDTIQVGEKTSKDGVTTPVLMNKVTAWTKHRNCRKYKDGVVFSPNKEVASGYFNTWTGFSVPPIKGADLTRIHNHIEEVICGKNPELIKYFYDWTAYTMQHADKQAKTALVLRGEKGTGKGILLHFIAGIWGQHSIYINNSLHLSGRFNGHLQDACFCFADEAFFAGDKSQEPVLKALITEPKLRIERKGLDTIECNNYLKIVMATNDDYAVPASKDERRYCVFDVSNHRVSDIDYFKALNEDCKNVKVKSAFLYEMLTRDVSHFVASRIPDTDGLKHQRLNSLCSAGKWLADCFSQGYFETNSDLNKQWYSFVSSENMYRSYSLWCKENRISTYDLYTINKLGRYLSDIFGSGERQAGTRGFLLGGFDEALKTFESHKKIDLGLTDQSLPAPKKTSG